jgi:hypothetical protein
MAASVRTVWSSARGEGAEPDAQAGARVAPRSSAMTARRRERFMPDSFARGDLRRGRDGRRGALETQGCRVSRNCADRRCHSYGLGDFSRHP